MSPHFAHHRIFLYLCFMLLDAIRSSYLYLSLCSSTLSGHPTSSSLCFPPSSFCWIPLIHSSKNNFKKKTEFPGSAWLISCCGRTKGPPQRPPSPSSIHSSSRSPERGTASCGSFVKSAGSSGRLAAQLHRMAIPCPVAATPVGVKKRKRRKLSRKWVDWDGLDGLADKGTKRVRQLGKGCKTGSHCPGNGRPRKSNNDNQKQSFVVSGLTMTNLLVSYL